MLMYLEELVGPAVRMGAVGFAELGNIHHFALKSLKMMQTHTHNNIFIPINISQQYY